MTSRDVVCPQWSGATNRRDYA